MKNLRKTKENPTITRISENDRNQSLNHPSEPTKINQLQKTSYISQEHAMNSKKNS